MSGWVKSEETIDSLHRDKLGIVFLNNDCVYETQECFCSRSSSHSRFAAIVLWQNTILKRIRVNIICIVPPMSLEFCIE